MSLSGVELTPGHGPAWHDNDRVFCLENGSGIADHLALPDWCPSELLLYGQGTGQLRRSELASDLE